MKKWKVNALFVVGICVNFYALLANNIFIIALLSGLGTGTLIRITQAWRENKRVVYAIPHKEIVASPYRLPAMPCQICQEKHASNQIALHS